MINGTKRSNVYLPGSRFNIKMTSYQYRKSHWGDKAILRTSFLHNGLSCIGQATSIYWIGVLDPVLSTWLVTIYCMYHFEWCVTSLRMYILQLLYESHATLPGHTDRATILVTCHVFWSLSLIWRLANVDIISGYPILNKLHCRDVKIGYLVISRGYYRPADKLVIASSQKYLHIQLYNHFMQVTNHFRSV